MDFYKKVEIFDVRGPDSHPKPLSILIKLGICIAIWTSCILIIATGFGVAEKYTSKYKGLCIAMWTIAVDFIQDLL